MSMLPIAGQCIFICQCHQPNLYNEKQACCPRMESLKNFSSYMSRGPPWRASEYEILKSTGFYVDFGFQNGFLNFKVDFWISKWISEFHVDLCWFLCQLMSSDALVHCKSLLKTLGRAVEQLAGCLAKQISSRGQSTTIMQLSAKG